MLFYYTDADTASSTPTTHHASDQLSSSNQRYDTRSVKSTSSEEGQSTLECLAEMLNSNEYKRRVKNFHDSEPIKVNEEGSFDTVCVLQREYAVVPNHSGVETLATGSCKATTCIIMLLYNPVSRVRAAAHVDSSECTFATMNSIIERVAGKDNEVQVSLIGAYDGNYVVDTLLESASAVSTRELQQCESQSIELSVHVIDCLRNTPCLCTVTLPAILTLNTTQERDTSTAVPRALDGAVDSIGNIFKPDFVDAGPVPQIRGLRFLSKWTDLEETAKYEERLQKIVYVIKRFPLDKLPQSFVDVFKE